MNSFFFQDYVEQALVPELRLGDIVVMDNLGSHKASGPAIESAGASLLCLSTHSPDFNPAEPASANWKPRSERQPSAASTGSGLPSARHRHHRSSQMGRASELPQLCRSPPDQERAFLRRRRVIDHQGRPQPAHQLLDFSTSFGVQVGTTTNGLVL
ncbi:transposase [Paeniroseomonas aquatica]|uniref:transposase n=1 Tax=Paeniroseomonas aquatica TaxID=373043 RepID=UPI00360638D2